MESTNTSPQTPEPEASATATPDQPPKKKRKAIQKWIDRILNVILIIAAITWLAQKIDTIPTDPKDITDVKTKRLEKAAAKAFGFKETPSISKHKDEAPPPPPVAKETLGESTSFVKETSALDVYHLINEEKELPVILFVYASWCNFCHNMLPVIDQYYAKQSDKIKVVAISIDENPKKLEYYFSHKVIPLNIPALNVSNTDEVTKIARMLSKKGLQFTGSIPYMAVFYQQTPVAQTTGFVEPDKLKDILDGATTLGKHPKPSDLPKDKPI
jgi:thiol-disulfide isomerase/thioredoxin